MADTKYPQSAERNEYRYIDFAWLDEIAEGLTAGGGKASGRDMAGDGVQGVDENRRSRMTAKEYLWRVRDAESDLKRLEQEYEQAKSDILHLKAIQYDADKITGGKIGDLSDAIAALEGYAERLNAQWDKLIALRKEAKVLIERIADGRYREVLTRRYLWSESWEYIAVGLGYAYHHTHKLHGQALNEFEAVFEKWIQTDTKTCDIV